MTSLSVRDAREADAPALADLCGQLGYPSTADATARRLAKLDADPEARTLVATTENGVIGLATVHLRETLNHEHPLGQLTLLIVDEKNRTHGVGRALVAEAEAWAREKGCKRFIVTTQL